MVCQVLLYEAASVYIYPLPHEPPSTPDLTPLGRHRADPCVPQQRPPHACCPHVVHICPCHSLNSSHSLLPPMCPHAHSLGLCPHSCPANRFVTTLLWPAFLILLIVSFADRSF